MSMPTAGREKTIRERIDERLFDILKESNQQIGRLEHLRKCLFGQQTEIKKEDTADPPAGILSEWEHILNLIMDNMRESASIMVEIESGLNLVMDEQASE